MPPILFTPGMSCDQRLWSKTWDLLPHLNQKRFVDFTQGGNLTTYLNQISQCASEQFSLVGFSMGGFIAIEYALQSPHRVSSLVLISTSARGYSDSEMQQRQKILHSASKKFHDLLSRARLKNWISPKHSEDQQNKILSIMESMMRDLGVQTLIEQQRATLVRLNRLEALKDLKLPLLIIHGEDDRLVPLEVAEELSRTIPGATLKVIQNCGHMVPLENPETTASLLQKWFDQLC